jgi:hypothetical protein
MARFRWLLLLGSCQAGFEELAHKPLSGSAGGAQALVGRNLASLAHCAFAGPLLLPASSSAAPHFLLKNWSGLALGGGHPQDFGQRPVPVLLREIDGGMSIVAGSGWVGAS